MAGVDLKKQFAEHYRCPTEPEFTDVPKRCFLMIDGAGDPNTAQAYADAVGALYPIAYGLRKRIKDETGIAYTVMPLEGLWWADDMERFSVDRKGDWRWRLLICQPDEVTEDVFAEVAPEVIAKKRLASGELVRLEPYEEGRSAQIMHLGPYADEAPTVETLHSFIDQAGCKRRGLHHEIYLTDPRRVAPEKNRTIIRQPVV